jgi:hypothetical protein
LNVNYKMSIGGRWQAASPIHPFLCHPTESRADDTIPSH